MLHVVLSTEAVRTSAVQDEEVLKLKFATPFRRNCSLHPGNAYDWQDPGTMEPQEFSCLPFEVSNTRSWCRPTKSAILLLLARLLCLLAAGSRGLITV